MKVVPAIENPVGPRFLDEAEPAGADIPDRHHLLSFSSDVGVTGRTSDFVVGLQLQGVAVLRDRETEINGLIRKSRIARRLESSGGGDEGAGGHADGSRMRKRAAHP